jgi:hypothetical protein
MSRFVAVVAAAMLVGTPAYAQDKTSEIDKIFSWATPTTPFQRGMLTIRFRRDTTGQVMGLDFSNPVLGKITFTRLR